MRMVNTEGGSYLQFDANPPAITEDNFGVAGPCILLGSDYNPAIGDARTAFLQREGRGCLSYASLHADMDAFYVPGLGYIPFSRKSLIPIYLGDPVCQQRGLNAIIRDALDFMDVRSFAYISKRTARVLHEFGFAINELGTETVIDVRRFARSSTHAAKLMRSVESAIIDGVVVVEELRCCECARQHDRVTGFGHRRPVRCTNPDCELDVRRFVARVGRVVVGQVAFEPVYDNGCIVGYGVGAMSSDFDDTYNVCDHIITRALSQFQREGIETVSLGLSPFHEIADDGEFRYSEPLKRTLRWMYRNSDTFAEARTLAFHDDKVQSTVSGIVQRKVYCASLDQFPVLDLFALLQGRGLNASSETMAYALRSIECALAPSLLDI